MRSRRNPDEFNGGAGASILGQKIVQAVSMPPKLVTRSERKTVTIEHKEMRLIENVVLLL